MEEMRGGAQNAFLSSASSAKEGRGRGVRFVFSAAPYYDELNFLLSSFKSYPSIPLHMLNSPSYSLFVLVAASKKVAGARANRLGVTDSSTRFREIFRTQRFSFPKIQKTEEKSNTHLSLHLILIQRFSLQSPSRFTTTKTVRAKLDMPDGNCQPSLANIP